MNLKAGLWQQQTLKMVMTQELSQAIALLQYSTQELIDFLENSSLENPLMQVENSTIQPVNPLIDRNRRRNHQKTENAWIDQIAERSFSLEDHLLTQLQNNAFSSEQIRVIRYLIQNIDGNGYFSSSLDEVAEVLNVPFELAEDCLIALQTLEPAGIGARNLQECLLIQLERENPDNDLALRILADYFVPFAEKKWRPISKELQVPLKDIQEVFDKIQHLSPRPGAILGEQHTTYLIPDAIVEQSGEGFTVRMCDDLLPKVSFNDHYYKKLTAASDQEVGRFLQEKVQDFQWIMKAIEQRKETLTKVVAKIVEKQLAFFQIGPQSLAPMTMKEVASEIDLHESTVSRAVREKYVQTPMGTFPLRSFFTSTIQTVSNENTSSAQVKKAIASMVEKEDKLRPLSDQEMVEQLRVRKGMVVSRRTIAKYREQLGIPSSSKRKRFD